MESRIKYGCLNLQKSITLFIKHTYTLYESDSDNRKYRSIGQLYT